MKPYLNFTAFFLFFLAAPLATCSVAGEIQEGGAETESLLAEGGVEATGRLETTLGRIKQRLGDPLLRPVSPAMEMPIEVPLLGQLPRESVEDAIPIYKGILDFLISSIGAQHPMVGRGYSFLASLYRALGENSAAEEWYWRALRVLEKQPDALDAAGVANNLGLLYMGSGETVKAERSFSRALELWSQVEAADPFYAAVIEQNLMSLYLDWGELKQADLWARKALENLAGAREADSAQVAIVRQNRAFLHLLLGRFEEAEIEYRQILVEGKLPSEARATALNSLAEVLRLRGQFEEAEDFYRQAAEIFPEVSVGRASVLANLSFLFYEWGDLERAAAFAEQALELRRHLDSFESPQVGVGLINLSMVEHSRGRLTEAEKLLKQGVAIMRATLTPEHPAFAGALENLALLYSETGRSEAALLLARQARTAKERQLRQVLSFGSEAERLAYLETTAPYDLLANLAPLLPDARDLADAVLRSKGVVLESLLEERRWARRAEAPAVREALLALYEARKRWLEKSFSLIAGGSAGRLGELARLEHELAEAEKALTAWVGELGASHRALEMEAREVQAVLKPDQVLVEMVRYQHHIGRGRLEPHYGALVLAARGEPKWVPLGSAVEIDGWVQDLACQLPGGDRGVARIDPPTPTGCGEAASLADLLRRLHRAVWLPIEARLPVDIRQVFVGPDAALHFLQMGVLLDGEDRFLVERYGFVYVGSGRDLLGGDASAPESTLLVYGDPDYGTRSDHAGSAIKLLPLSYTAIEARELSRLGAGHGWQVSRRTGKQAREASLRELKSVPGILHLATHGFVLPTEASPWPALRLESHPMLASFLALADAQTTLDAWHRGEVPPPADDGILTAVEISDLPLDGTWLVVLAACDTGLGKARPGEGVFGLRRGFTMSGTRYLLTTLWSVEDRATADFMVAFYSQLLSGDDPATALTTVQRQKLASLRETDGLPAAVRKAGGFVLSLGAVR